MKSGRDTGQNRVARNARRAAYLVALIFALGSILGPGSHASPDDLNAAAGKRQVAIDIGNALPDAAGESPSDDLQLGSPPVVTAVHAAVTTELPAHHAHQPHAQQNGVPLDVAPKTSPPTRS